MKTLLRYSKPIAVGLLFAALSACLVGGEYRGDGGAYGVGFYEPYGYDYGGWVSGYQVGPPRREWHRPDEPRGLAPSRSFRPAPQDRPVPSIPSRPPDRPHGHPPGR
jgi:hypothetical protein